MDYIPEYYTLPGHFSNFPSKFVGICGIFRHILGTCTRDAGVVHPLPPSLPAQTRADGADAVVLTTLTSGAGACTLHTAYRAGQPARRGGYRPHNSRLRPFLMGSGGKELIKPFRRHAAAEIKL